MAPRKKYIDSEWADSLVGLCMKVPDYWWKEYTTHNLNDGRIFSFDESTQKWHLLLQTQEDGDDLYPMAYSAVCEYSDKQLSSFQDFVLPVEPILEGGGMKSMPVVLDTRDRLQRNGLKCKKEKVDRLIPFHGLGEMKSSLLI
jgi:hypothetical protein